MLGNELPDYRANSSLYCQSSYALTWVDRRISIKVTIGRTVMIVDCERKRKSIAARFARRYQSIPGIWYNGRENAALE